MLSTTPTRSASPPPIPLTTIYQRWNQPRYMVKHYRQGVLEKPGRARDSIVARMLVALLLWVWIRQDLDRHQIRFGTHTTTVVLRLLPRGRWARRLLLADACVPSDSSAQNIAEASAYATTGIPSERASAWPRIHMTRIPPTCFLPSLPFLS